jgi:hypothetical protein
MTDNNKPFDNCNSSIYFSKISKKLEKEIKKQKMLCSEKICEVGYKIFNDLKQ